MKKLLPSFMALRRVRKDCGMSQTELAQKAGISQQWIAQLEAGQNRVSDEVKKKIAEVLNVSIWVVFPEVRMSVDFFSILESRFGVKIPEEKAPFYKEVLSRLDEDEVGDLVASGMTFALAQKQIRAYAKKLNIAE